MNCKFCSRDLADGIILGDGIIRCIGCLKVNIIPIEMPKEEYPETEPEAEMSKPRRKIR